MTQRPEVFPCTGCGLCCRAIVKRFPDWPRRADGEACVHLRHDNTCAIYQTRPLICRVDAMLRLSNRETKEFYQANADICNRLQEEAGTDESFRVKIP